ncbi:MAG: SDR family oxidoreductase [Candidatus Korobacteraceae bacterium]|jgi:3-oxoacyl-[acyl-carrier protein] reductase
MDLGLKDRVAIVAASSQGIGRATALAFAAEGCKLAICARNSEALRRVADEIEHRHGAEVLAQVADVSDPHAVQRFVGAVGKRFGRIDICVTNAGGPPAKPFLEIDSDLWRRAFELNLLSVISFAREVIPWMQQRKWGRIITVTSLSTRQPLPDLILSNTIRTGVLGLVRSLANDFGRDGILVNNVGPGATRTERFEQISAGRARASGRSKEDVIANFVNDTATGRLGEPEEVAAAIVWLASERANSITGQTVLTDHGSYRGL